MSSATTCDAAGVQQIEKEKEEQMQGEERDIWRHTDKRDMGLYESEKKERDEQERYKRIECARKGLAQSTQPSPLITFSLTTIEANLILESLGNQPFVKVYELIAKLQTQARKES